MATYSYEPRPTAQAYYSMAGPSHHILYHHPSPSSLTSPSPSSPSPPPFYSQPSSPTEMYSVSHHEHQAPGPSKPALGLGLHHTTSLNLKGKSTGRPKLGHKKPSCSTRDKSREVQSSLEKQVEKAKGFQAFFVPLGKGLPAAPPSSPVLGARGHTHEAQGGKDYFEDWVEDVRGKMGSGKTGQGLGSAMDLD